ncbi:MAG: hypothetical protein MUE41_06045 [Gemmatimonadaceae bacterium]|jgi:hypothetical protein|nr:hypothetical protein [Gemmatimonadaceae bacterium]
MHTHVRIVAILQIVRAALIGLGAIGSFFGMALGALGSLAVGDLFTSLGLGIGAFVSALIMGTIAVLSLIVGLGLLAHKSWARYVAIVLSLFSLFNWPVGTVLGGYSLWVLLHGETKRLFEGTTTYA